MAGHIFHHIQDFITGLFRPRLLPREEAADSGDIPASAVTWADNTVMTWGDGTIVTWSNA